MVADLTDPRRQEPGFLLGERQMLEAWLEFHRATLLLKCEGLDAADRKRRPVPTSKLSLHGLVRHMAEVERNWFRRRLLSEADAPYIWLDKEVEDSELVPLDDADWDADLLAWQAECDASRAAAIIAVDPVPGKRETALRLGATHAVADVAEAAGLAAEVNPAERGASSVIVAVGELTAQTVTGAFRACARGGAVVIAGMSHDPRELNIQLPGTVLAATEKRILGSFFGSCNPARDIPLLLGAYRRGELRLDELVSREYRLDEISAGYADLAAGRNLRGVIKHSPGPVATRS